MEKKGVRGILQINVTGWEAVGQLEQKAPLPRLPLRPFQENKRPENPPIGQVIRGFWDGYNLGTTLGHEEILHEWTWLACAAGS